MKQFLRKLGIAVVSAVVTVMLASYAAAMLQAIARRPPDIRGDDRLFLAAVGFAVGIVVVSVVARFTRLYVFGHELTHWLVAKLFLRRTSGFRIGADGGSVMVEGEQNIWIVLAPYCVPLWALVWTGILALVRLWYRPEWLPTVLWAGIGFWYAYHVVMTIITLSRQQPDLKVFGTVLSLAFIIAANLTLLYWVHAVLNGELRAAAHELAVAWRGQWRLLNGAVRKFT